jgi:hypothetical protein
MADILEKLPSYTVAVIIALAVVGCGGSAATLANTAHRAKRADLQVVRWRLVASPDSRVVRIASTAEYCYGAPKPEIATVAVRYSRRAVSLTALLSNSRGDEKNACMGLRVGLERSVKLSQKLQGRALYDGGVSPPERRWPRP